MKQEFRATRRRVLQQLAGALGVVSLNVSVTAAPVVAAASDPIARAIDAMISNKDSAVVIGTAYMRKFAQERSTEVLHSRISESVRDEHAPLDVHALLRRVEIDFARGEIVNLHGWLLSRTEARLCALFAMRR